MVALYEPNLTHAGSYPPDSWCSLGGLIPSREFVVSRSKDGKALSHYGQLSWDYTPYSNHGEPAFLHFSSWTDEPLSDVMLKIIDEMRFLIFVLIWKRRGPSLGVETLKGYLVAVKTVARYAISRKCLVIDVLCSKAILKGYSRSDVPVGIFVYIRSLLSVLFELGEAEVGFSVASGFDKLFDKKINDYWSRARQYPVIPTKIYGNFIGALRRELDDWEAVAERYLAMIKALSEDALLGKHKGTQAGITGKSGTPRKRGSAYKPDFSELLEQYDLTDYFAEKGLACSGKGAINGLTCVLTSMKLSVVAFTGMRNKEAATLPYKCIVVEPGLLNRDCKMVEGKTTKIGKRKTRWVTNAEGHRALRLAQRIADVIYKKIGENPRAKGAEKRWFPLFIPPMYLGIMRGVPDAYQKSFRCLKFLLSEPSVSLLRSRLQATITDDDIKELELIDEHRAWRSEREFQVGRQWTITDHQLRRSLAVYAQRSGLVSLPSLRRQLQHITEEMSAYYAKGSESAKNFIATDKRHFAVEWQNAGPESSFLAYARDLLFKDVDNFGGHVEWFRKKVDAGDAIIFDRQTTLKRFKAGEIFYQESPFGGCTSDKPCKKVPFRILDTKCIGEGCPNLVGNFQKLEQVVRAQASLVDRLRPDSIEWRAERAELDVLLEVQQRELVKRKQL